MVLFKWVMGCRIIRLCINGLSDQRCERGISAEAEIDRVAQSAMKGRVKPWNPPAGGWKGDTERAL